MKFNVDSMLMAGINAGVYTYNWVFGGTKEDLARILQISNPLVQIVGSFSDGLERGLAGLVITCLFDGPIVYFILGANKKQIQLEDQAKERHMLDSKVEGIYKPANKTLGLTGIPTNLALDIWHINSSDCIDHLGWHYSDLIGSQLRSLGFLTMCADNLPPRKNVFRRAYEKISELSDKILTSPIGKPVPSYS